MSAAGRPFLEITDLGKSFGDVRVLEGLSLELAEGEILALLGLSGSGKTTALRLLAGFEQPDQGEIRLAGEPVDHLGPDRRGFGMVFQHYALFPHMTVAENVAFGLESQGWPRPKIGPRITEMLTLVDLADYADRRVSAISGGQQQRVALARALAPEPRLLLLDEPLSNLDPALRERTRSELRDAVRRIGITTVLVTHEQEEAFHVGDRIAVLNQGRLEQIGAARELYRRPETPFVASFIGRSGRVAGTVEQAVEAGERAVLSIPVAGGPPVPWTAIATRPFAREEPAELWVRPESLRLAPPAEPHALRGRVAELRFLGASTYALVDLEVGPGSSRLEVKVGDSELEVGQEARLGLVHEGAGEGSDGPPARLFSARGEGSSSVLARRAGAE